MPDMQTALSKILNEWDKPIEEINQPENQMETTQAPTEGKTLFRTTNNVTRATFNFIRDNPGHTRRGVIDKLETFGYKEGSTTSLITQMLNQRLIRKDENGGLHANFPEYTPLKSSLKKLMAEKNPRKPRVVKAVKEAKPKPVPQPTVRTEAAPQPQAKQDKQERRIIDIEEWLNEVPLMQARMVYMRLKYIFEGDAA